MIKIIQKRYIKVFVLSNLFILALMGVHEISLASTKVQGTDQQKVYKKESSEGVKKKSTPSTRTRKQKMSSKSSLSYVWSFEANVETAVTLNEAKDVTQNYSFTGNYTFLNKNKISANISAEKRFLKTIGPHQKEFALGTPYVQYTRLAILRYGMMSWNTVFVRLIATCSELYKATSRYGSLRLGGDWSLRPWPMISFGHTIMGDKHFNKYENGPRGTNHSWQFINVFSFSVLPLKNLTVSLSYTMVDSITYGGSRNSIHSGAISALFNLPYQWSIYGGISSNSDYRRYDRGNLDLYNRNNASAFVGITKGF